VGWFYILYSGLFLALGNFRKYFRVISLCIGTFGLGRAVLRIPVGFCLINNVTSNADGRESEKSAKKEGSHFWNSRP
jgi:hypothetical protein